MLDDTLGGMRALCWHGPHANAMVSHHDEVMHGSLFNVSPVLAKKRKVNEKETTGKKQREII